MDIIIKNGKIMRFKDKIELEEKDLLIKNGKIESIEKNIEQKNDEYIIDAKGNIVMPGLINAHAHMAMSIFRETTEGCTLMEWLQDKIWPIEDKMTNEDAYYATLLSCIEAISTGTTCIVDFYFLSEGIRKAIEESKIRASITRVLMDVDGNGDLRMKEFLDFYNSRNQKNDLITYTVAPHGLYTCTKELVDKSIEIAEEKGLIFNTHLLETKGEVEDIKKLQETDAAEVLNKLKNVKSIFAHGVVINDKDMEILKKLDCTIVHNPVSNMRLGSEIADITKLQKERINIALGTDGQGSGSNLDLFEVMRLSILLQGGIHDNENKINVEDVIKMATINGAKALGLEKIIGSIDVGKDADIIIVNIENKIDNIKMIPNSNWISNIVYNTNGNNVDTTIVKGEILMENRKIKNLDIDNVLKECKKRVEKLMS